MLPPGSKQWQIPCRQLLLNDFPSSNFSLFVHVRSLPIMHPHIRHLLCELRDLGRLGELLGLRRTGKGIDEISQGPGGGEVEVGDAFAG